jgi:hypothetical protein
MLVLLLTIVLQWAMSSVPGTTGGRIFAASLCGPRTRLRRDSRRASLASTRNHGAGPPETTADRFVRTVLDWKLPDDLSDSQVPEDAHIAEADALSPTPTNVPLG